jgi:hypothetical protein
MIRTAGQVDQVVLDWGVTGIAASIGVRVLDNSGDTTIARTTGFTEYPAGSGVYYLDDFTFPDTRGSYTLFYDVDAGVGAPGNTATEELEITSTIGEPFSGDTYATADELARILKIRTPSADQTAALERALAIATYEIDREIDRDDDDPVAGAETSLCVQVCLDRAADLWRHTESIPGLTGLLGDQGDVVTSQRFPWVRYSWERYAQRLAPLKGNFGIA